MAKVDTLPDVRLGEFEVEYVMHGCRPIRARLVDVSDLAFELAEPVRPFRFSRGQGHFPGWWWTATTSRLVGFESWLERDHLMMLDFDPAVVGIASQPFRLWWHDRRRRRSHPPDYFVRTAAGDSVVVDVRADDRVDEKALAVFHTTGVACGQAGWQFRRVGALDPVLVANVRWLSRYRQPRFGTCPDLEAELIAAFSAPVPLLAGAEKVADRLTTLPLVFHLLWRGRLTTDLARGPLSMDSLVSGPDGRPR